MPADKSRSVFSRLKSERWGHPLALSGALLVAAVVYLRTVIFDFVYDDLGQIVYNPKVKSWKLATSYFRSHVWSQNMDLALYYRPLYMLWLTLNYALFGLEAFYWHFFAIAVHLTVCLLLYFFVRRLVQDRWTAVVAVLLFGLHPAHVESVAWISGTTDSLLACFILASLLCYWKCRESSGTKANVWLAASLFLAFCGALVKETAIVIPGIIFSVECFLAPPDGEWKRRFPAGVRAAVPYAAVSVAFLAMRGLALGSVTPPFTRSGRLPVMLAWPEDMLFYISHVLFPFRLSVFYDRLTVSHPDLQNFVFPVLLLFAGAIGLYYGSRRSRLFAFLAAWWIITMVPVINVTLWNNVETLHDRYLYLPSVAVCIALALLLARLRELHFEKTTWVALTIIAAGYALMTMEETQYWKNDIVLAQRGIDVSPGHPIAPQVMGNALIREGRTAAAIPYFVEAMEAMPTNVDTLCNLSYCYAEIDSLSLAQDTVQKAIAFDPSEPRARLILCMIRLKQNRLEEAEAECRRGLALQRVPTSVTVFHYQLGNVLYAKGDVQGALREYRAELKNDAGSDPAYAQAEQRIDQIEHAER